MDTSRRSFKILELTGKGLKTPFSENKTECLWVSSQPKIKNTWFCNRPLSPHVLPNTESFTSNLNIEEKYQFEATTSISSAEEIKTNQLDLCEPTNLEASTKRVLLQNDMKETVEKYTLKSPATFKHMIITDNTFFYLNEPNTDEVSYDNNFLNNFSEHDNALNKTCSDKNEIGVDNVLRPISNEIKVVTNSEKIKILKDVVLKPAQKKYNLNNSVEPHVKTRNYGQIQETHNFRPHKAETLKLQSKSILGNMEEYQPTSTEVNPSAQKITKNMKYFDNLKFKTQRQCRAIKSKESNAAKTKTKQLCLREPNKLEASTRSVLLQNEIKENVEKHISKPSTSLKYLRICDNKIFYLNEPNTGEVFCGGNLLNPFSDHDNPLNKTFAHEYEVGVDNVLRPITNETKILINSEEKVKIVEDVSKPAQNLDEPHLKTRNCSKIQEIPNYSPPSTEVESKNVGEKIGEYQPPSIEICSSAQNIITENLECSDNAPTKAQTDDENKKGEDESDDDSRDPSYMPLESNYDSESDNHSERDKDSLSPKQDAVSFNSINIENENVSNISSLKKKVIRKPDFCFYCEDNVLNFGRHVLRNHSHETEVANILSKPKNSLERKALFASLRKKGNYLKNSQDCFKPMHINSVPNRKYLPCPFCLGFYSSKFLYKHKKFCKAGTGKGKISQADGQNKLLSHLKIDKQLRDTVFPKMRADDISLVAKKDFLICAFGTRYLKTHREKHSINVTSRKMRELAKLLMEVKKREPCIKNLFAALQPKYFDLFVDAVKTVAGYDSIKDTFDAPTYAMNISTSLKQCCDVGITLTLKKQCPGNSIELAETQASFQTMTHLLKSNWRFDISSRAAENLNLTKWNKVTIVPLAADLKILKQYLTNSANDACKKLDENPGDIVSYTILLETVYCRTILLNRKRPGELQRMYLHSYEQCKQDKSNYEEFNTAITPTEQILLKKFRRVVIRGKRGRGVPVLFSTEVQKHINILIKHRQNFLGLDNPYLFGNPGYSTPISGYKVLSKYAHASGAKNPKAITATKLRKHLATLSQIFHMNDSEIDQLATFMGHTTSVHKNSYRLPDDVYQTAKLSKLLLLMETGSSAKYKGKALEDIDLNLDDNLLETLNVCEDNEIEEILSESSDEETDLDKTKELNIKETNTNSKNKKPEKKKREVTPWTYEQKQIVADYFKDHISKKIPPKRVECEDLIKKHQQILTNKNWLKIKVFIQNIYTHKTKLK